MSFSKNGKRVAESEFIAPGVTGSLISAVQSAVGLQFFTDAMEAKVRALAMVGTELRKAIASSQLFLVYQPQIDVDTGQIVSVEALVRWCHPVRGRGGPVFRNRMAAWLRWILGSITPPISRGLPA